MTGIISHPFPPVMLASAALIFAASPKPTKNRKKTLALKSARLAHSTPFMRGLPC
nr:MAG TPA: hypothetical protein [Caudoviricetes sp.]